MITLTIIKDIFARQREVLETDDLLACLYKRFPSWPQNARLFHQSIAFSREVTPRDAAGVERLAGLEGQVYLLSLPHGGVTGVIIAVIVAVAAVAAAVFLKPKIPSISTRNVRNISPNNEFSARANKARPHERIPDILGTVRSTPDLIVSPYSEYDANVEIEHAVMCIGRGQYEIHDMYDGETACDQIAGVSVQVYKPQAHINSDAPYYRVGQPIDGAAMLSIRSNSVNGQKLEPSNKKTYTGQQNLLFCHPNRISLLGNVYGTTPAPEAADDADVSLVERFKAGDVIVISQATIDANGNPAQAGAASVGSLNGRYTIAAIADNSLYLDKPEEVSQHWAALQSLPGGQSAPLSAVLAATGENWVGPFILEDSERTGIWANLVAMNGLYKDNGRSQYAVNVTVRFEVTPIDKDNEPTGAAQRFDFTLKGSTLNRGTIALTAKMATGFKGRCRIRARRITETDANFDGSVMDEVQIKDLYAMSELPADSFGNVTIVRAKTVATDGALAVKERKLNCLVTRQIATPFNSELVSTNQVADIFCHISLDPYIGNRKPEELDIENIYATLDEVEAYFGTPLLAEFCHTLDDQNLSYEETASLVAGVSFCTPYRMGSVIRLSFEKETDLSVMLFNHRNKIPNTETRTVSFGYSNDNDGVQYEYVSPEDDATLTIHIPEDKSAVNPAKIESIGVRNKAQAHMHAWRSWNKMKYQSVALEFSATYEADLLLRGERILVSGNTNTISPVSPVSPASQTNPVSLAHQVRPQPVLPVSPMQSALPALPVQPVLPVLPVLEGEVEAMQGLEVFTARPLNLEAGREYVCFLQLCDRTTQAIPALAGTTERSFILRYPPNIPLVYDDGKYARTTFMLAGEAEAGANAGHAFIVTEKKAQRGLTVALEAVNYDARYYQRDADFKRGLIDDL